MNFTLISPENKKEAVLSLPCCEEGISAFCTSLEVKNTAKTEVIVAKMEKHPDLFLLLGRKTCCLEELNFLMKALAGMKSAEKELFFMATGANSSEDLPFLINLVFNLSCYSVISDFSYLHLMGRALHLSQGESSEEHFDNTAFFLQSIQDGKFKITEKGVVFFEKSQWKDHYMEGQFPYLPEKHSPFALKITKEDNSEYLNLPTKESALFKVFDRLSVKELKDCTMEVYGLSSFEAMESIVIGEFTFQNCNKLAKLMSKLRADEREKVEELVEFVKITSFSDLLVLVSSLDFFSVLPEVKTAEEYGQFLVSRLNRGKFDEKLSEYIDFEAYGQEISHGERGVFTDSGYLKYEGYNQEMIDILVKNLGYEPRTGQKTGELKLFMPITTDATEKLQPEVLLNLLPLVQKFLAEYQEKLDQPRGFMSQYPNRDSIYAKVEKYIFDAEKQSDSLFAVAILNLNDQLTAEELQRMKQVIGGQVAGNLNEMLEQESFVAEGEVGKVSLWNASHWYLKTEDELKEMW